MSSRPTIDELNRLAEEEKEQQEQQDRSSTSSEDVESSEERGTTDARVGEIGSDDRPTIQEMNQLSDESGSSSSDSGATAGVEAGGATAGAEAGGASGSGGAGAGSADSDSGGGRPTIEEMNQRQEEQQQSGSGTNNSAPPTDDGGSGTSSDSSADSSSQNQTQDSTTSSESSTDSQTEPASEPEPTEDSAISQAQDKVDPDPVIDDSRNIRNENIPDFYRSRVARQIEGYQQSDIRLTEGGAFDPEATAKAAADRRLDPQTPIGLTASDFRVTDDGSVELRSATERRIAASNLDYKIQDIDVDATDIEREDGSFTLDTESTQEYASEQLDEETRTDVLFSDVQQQEGGSFQLNTEAFREEAAAELGIDSEQVAVEDQAVDFRETQKNVVAGQVSQNSVIDVEGEEIRTEQATSRPQIENFEAATQNVTFRLPTDAQAELRQQQAIEEIENRFGFEPDSDQIIQRPEEGDVEYSDELREEIITVEIEDASDLERGEDYTVDWRTREEMEARKQLGKSPLVEYEPRPYDIEFSDEVISERVSEQVSREIDGVAPEDVTVEDGEVTEVDRPERFGDIPEVAGVKVDDVLRDAGDSFSENVVDPTAEISGDVVESGTPPPLRGTAETVTESAVGGAGEILNVPATTAGLIEIGEYIGEGGAETVQGRGGEYVDRSVDAAVEAGEAFKDRAVENPVKTGAFLGGSLVGSYGVIRGASRLSGTAGRAAAYTIQPGEELAGLTGAKLVPGRAGRVLFPQNEPLIFSEEAAIMGAKRVGRETRRTADRIRGREIESDDPDLDVVPSGRSEVGSEGTGSVLDAEAVDEARGVTGPSRRSRVRGELNRRVSAEREAISEMADRPFFRDVRAQSQLSGGSRRIETSERSDMRFEDYDGDPTRPPDAGGTFDDVRQDALTQTQESLRSQAQRPEAGTFEPEPSPFGRDRGPIYDPETDEFSLRRSQATSELEAIESSGGFSSAIVAGELRRLELAERQEVAQEAETPPGTEEILRGVVDEDARSESLSLEQQAQESALLEEFRPETMERSALDSRQETGVMERSDSILDSEFEARQEIEQEVEREAEFEQETELEQRQETEVEQEVEQEVELEAETRFRRRFETEVEIEGESEFWGGPFEDGITERETASETRQEEAWRSPVASASDVSEDIFGSSRSSIFETEEDEEELFGPSEGDIFEDIFGGDR